MGTPYTLYGGILACPNSFSTFYTAKTRWNAFRGAFFNGKMQSKTTVFWTFLKDPRWNATPSTLLGGMTSVLGAQKGCDTRPQGAHAEAVHPRALDCETRIFQIFGSNIPPTESVGGKWFRRFATSGCSKGIRQYCARLQIGKIGFKQSSQNQPEPGRARVVGAVVASDPAACRPPAWNVEEPHVDKILEPHEAG